jgi:hypothetical protein
MADAPACLHLVSAQTDDLAQCPIEQHSFVDESKNVDNSIPADAKDDVMSWVANRTWGLRDVIPAVANVINSDVRICQAFPVDGGPLRVFGDVFHCRNEQRCMALSSLSAELRLAPA